MSEYGEYDCFSNSEHSLSSGGEVEGPEGGRGASLFVSLHIPLAQSRCRADVADMIPSVAVIVLDTLRADILDRPALLLRLPMLNRLFAESFVFKRAYPSSHWTLPSHASSFSP